MDLVEPLLTVCPQAEHRVLAGLAAADEALSGEDIARRAGLSGTGAMRVLDRLVADGLVVRVRCGATAMHAVNDQHLALAPLLELNDLAARLAERAAGHVAA